MPHIFISHNNAHVCAKDWKIDETYLAEFLRDSMPSIVEIFNATLVRINQLVHWYSDNAESLAMKPPIMPVSSEPHAAASLAPKTANAIADFKKFSDEAVHALVLATIAARRTDDPKVGVGAVLVDSVQGQYISVGWNCYPRKTQRHSYPHAGADEAGADEELKYISYASVDFFGW